MRKWPESSPSLACFSILALGYCSASHRAALRICSRMTHSQRWYLGSQLQEDRLLAFCTSVGFQQDQKSDLSPQWTWLPSTHKPSLRTKSNKNFIWNCLEPVNLLPAPPIADMGQWTQSIAQGRMGRKVVTTTLSKSFPSQCSSFSPTKSEGFRKSHNTVESTLLTQHH